MNNFNMVRKKDALIILVICTMHIALSVWAFGTIIGAAIVGDPNADTAIVRIVKVIILIPYAPLFITPSLKGLGLSSFLGVMALYSVIFDTAVYLILRKVILTIKQRCCLR